MKKPIGSGVFRLASRLDARKSALSRAVKEADKTIRDAKALSLDKDKDKDKPQGEKSTGGTP